MIKAEDIASLVERKLEGTDKFMVAADVKPGNRIFVFLDGDHGVTINDCAEMSHYIESALNRDKEDYELNVSSAGLDQPFSLRRQYVKNIGKPISLKLIDGSKKDGILEEVSEDGIWFQPQPEKKKKGKEEAPRMFVAFSGIKEAKNIITFKR